MEPVAKFPPPRKARTSTAIYIRLRNQWTRNANVASANDFEKRLRAVKLFQQAASSWLYSRFPLSDGSRTYGTSSRAVKHSSPGDLVHAHISQNSCWAGDMRIRLFLGHPIGCRQVYKNTLPWWPRFSLLLLFSLCRMRRRWYKL